MIALAFDLGGHHLRGATVDLDGKILEHRSERTAGGRDPLAVVAQISRIASDLNHTIGTTSDVTAAGFGIPGFMDTETGFVFASPNFPAWTNFHLRTRRRPAA